MTSPWQQSGVTLIEVLIALVIMAIGLIGLAAMQTAAIGNNQLSFEYTRVASATQTMAEAMRANRTGVLENVYLFEIGVPEDAPADCRAVLCSSAQKALWDIKSWYDALAESEGGGAANLPGVQIAISCETAACDVNDARIITAYWDRRRSGATGTGCDPDESDDLACFRLPFLP